MIELEALKKGTHNEKRGLQKCLKSKQWQKGGETSEKISKILAQSWKIEIFRLYITGKWTSFQDICADGRIY